MITNPSRDNIPPNHPRRIAQIYHLSERELAHESVEVRQLCRDLRDRQLATAQGVVAENDRRALECRGNPFGNFAAIWAAQAAWSQATFGLDSERGPIGPLKHLAKEAIEAQEVPHDLMEFVDCLFLTFDATRRAGFTFAQLHAAAWEKLAINKARKWQTPPKGDEAIEHVRE